MQIEYTPIGTIHTPYRKQGGVPIQSVFGSGSTGHIILEPEFEEGLDSLEGFEYIWLLFAFHKSTGYSLKVKPYLENVLRGVFATRAPRRPNQIGMSAVRLVSIKGIRLEIADVDILNGTPLLDIKPCVPRFDNRPESARIGWLQDRSLLEKSIVADNRFEE